MKKHIPSIFNDVVGPVMRGPSSSHCAGALRIGRLIHNLMDGKISHILFEMDVNGSLATTHESQGSDMGLFGGILNWNADDERLPDSKEHCEEQGIDIQFKIDQFNDPHPNTYRLTVTNKNETHFVKAISTGGGMIEIIEIDGFIVSIYGDYYETLIFTNQTISVNKLNDDTIINTFVHDDRHLIELKTRNALDDESFITLNIDPGNSKIMRLIPVLPILSSPNMQVPFSNYSQMIAYCAKNNMKFWEAAILYESMRGSISSEEVFEMMKELVKTIQQSIQTGLEGTNYIDRILRNQSHYFNKRIKENKLLPAGVLNKIILYVTAIMEAKSSMETIVAAPTAGSCGALPGAIIGAADTLNLDNDEIAKAMLAAGLIGVFILNKGTFAAEVGGCQAECGSASGMAAAGLVTLARGSLKSILAAASMALQNSFGMTCDPVANRVEVPCLGKNVMAASNALSCANMAIAGYNQVIPLDEVIIAMDKVGKCLPHELRCTGLGGLSVTPTSKKIEENLNK